MPIIRNPFRRTEDAARVVEPQPDRRNVSAPRSIEIKEPAEYKLSGEHAPILSILLRPLD